MASRRDELNAYTFARKRMVGAFLLPSGGGNDEDAPRPVRAILPSVVVSAVILAGFGLAGVIKPSAPPGWDSGKFIIQGKESTTRYVVLVDPKTGDKVLHQVLNMSSARLVLPAGATVQVVADSVLDKYPHHGATIGIQYAPDRLPKEQDAGQAKVWSVCDRSGADANAQTTNAQSAINQAVFIAADDEAKTLAQPDLLLGDDQSLFVQGPSVGVAPVHPGTKYLVDSQGRRHAVGVEDTRDNIRTNLETALFHDGTQPQQVTDEWLRTLDNGDPITFPDIPGFDPAKPMGSTLNISQSEEKKVGRLVKFQDSYFAVGRDNLFQITHFQAELIRNNPAMNAVYGSKGPTIAELSPNDFSNLRAKVDKRMLEGAKTWPTEPAPQVNAGVKNPRNVICSTYNGLEGGKTVKRSVWASDHYPAQVSSGSASAHVTPGHGLLYRAFDGDPGDNSGINYLITETGLRYSLPANDDGGQGAAASAGDAAASGQPQNGDKKETNEAQARLGYKTVVPPLVPVTWSKLVPAGPVLNTNTATQAQNA